jgi:Nucleotidyl transferase AbiEii toxin, Type IV TA system
MPEKPLFAYDYTKENVELVRQTCLYVSTKLGDLLDDLVVVGGLVPSLLIPDESLPAGEDVHIGTMDLDLGLSLAILNRERYEDLTQRLHRSGFEPDENEEGNTTFQRWKARTSSGLKVTIDFLIPPSLDTDKGGDLRHIEKDFAAVITPGLRLAFQDKKKVSLKGVTLKGEKAERKIWMCGPGAFIVLKAQAFQQRGENKDAYDLYFVIRNYGSGIDEVCECLSPLLKEAETKSALEILSRDFVDPDSIGPSRVAQFQYNEPNPDLQADVAGYIRELLDRCTKVGS